MSTQVVDAEAARDSIERLLGELRPKLHRYCAGMTGSVIDGEDIVQETVIKVLEALPESAAIRHPEAWLFRIARNASLDFLRRRNRLEALRSDEDPEQVIDLAAAADRRQVVTASLGTFMRLPVTERSSVILMDVLGYSLEEIGGIANSSIPAVKAALHRGRARLRELAAQPDDTALPALPEAERVRLADYADRFNARDFDGIRDMLAADVRLELVNRVRLRGRDAVGKYFTNYAGVADWHLVPGSVDGQPALLVRNPGAPEAVPGYFVLVSWEGDRIAGIRDFRHAPYAIEGARLSPHGQTP
jgi:RNA polymerase sigma-70 factor (ECF subfamily)